MSGNRLSRSAMLVKKCLFMSVNTTESAPDANWLNRAKCYWKRPPAYSLTCPVLTRSGQSLLSNNSNSRAAWFNTSRSSLLASGWFTTSCSIRSSALWMRGHIHSVRGSSRFNDLRSGPRSSLESLCPCPGWGNYNGVVSHSQTAGNVQRELSQRQVPGTCLGT
jgi:hypothetical protein